MLLNYVSGLEEDCCNLSVNEVLEFAMKAAERCVNGKRAEMLRLIAAQREPRTITSTAEEISCSIGCPRSTVWANLNLLKELRLVENGRGRPIRVTKLGRLLLEKRLAANGGPGRAAVMAGGGNEYSDRGMEADGEAPE
jgi:hypothetical protein